MATQTRLMTAEELAQLPDDGWRSELVRGELIRMAPASYDHGGIAMNLGGALHQYVRAHPLGRVSSAETGFLIARAPDTVLAPDVAFVQAARAPALGQIKGYWVGVPDLVAEVISPGDTYTEVDEKVTVWLDAGVRLVIVVDPRRQIVTVHHSPTEFIRLTINEQLDGGTVVPGWILPVRELFT